MWAAQIISLRQATMYVYNNKKGLTQAARSSPRTTQGTITGQTESETWDSWKAAHGTSFHSLSIQPDVNFYIHPGVDIHPHGHCRTGLDSQTLKGESPSLHDTGYTAITQTSDLWAVCLPLLTGGTSSLGSWFSAGNSHTDSNWAGALSRDHALEGTGIL